MILQKYVISFFSVFLIHIVSLHVLTGTHTMALLEKLEPGNTYLVKISASNQIGDGPFSNTVELLPKRGNIHRSKNPRHSDTVADTIGKITTQIYEGDEDSGLSNGSRFISAFFPI